jgi:hypothetical protein
MNKEFEDQLAKEVLKRMDIKKECERWGFKFLPGAVPNKDGWLEGESPFRKGYRAFVNVGYGPDRGQYVEFHPDDFPDKLDG